MRRPVIHNRRLSGGLHRVVNALFGCFLLAGLGALGLGYFSSSSWLSSLSFLGICLTPVAFIALLLVDPQRFSLIEGVAGDLGNDEL